MDIVKDSLVIHKALVKRWTDLERKNAHICKDAEERGFTINKGHLSTYRKHARGLNQVQIIWLCMRYDIPVRLEIGNAEIQGGEIKRVIPKYNERRCLENLNRYKHIFVKNGKE